MTLKHLLKDVQSNNLRESNKIVIMFIRNKINTNDIEPIRLLLDDVIVNFDDIHISMCHGVSLMTFGVAELANKELVLRNMVKCKIKAQRMIP